METLPYLPLEKIVQQLTPQDLARCSAVCRAWREAFNQDWLWQPHCDPELEEPLRTVPSVATPTFVTPEVENPTLSPICRWRLAFMRETHLWNNWRKENFLNKINESTIELKNNNKDIEDMGIDHRLCEEIECKNYRGIKDIKFLTDTLLVVFLGSYIEILDLSVKPVACVAVTTASSVRNHDRCSVVGTSMLLVEKGSSVDVYNVDLSDKLITLNHCIDLVETGEFVHFRKRLVKEQLYIFGDEQTSNMTSFELNTGLVLKTVPFPAKENPSARVKFYEIQGSSTSDFVVVTSLMMYKYGDHEEDYVMRYKYHIYSILQLAFLYDVKINFQPLYSDRPLQVTLHCHWLAYQEFRSFTVYNIQTRDVLLLDGFIEDRTVEGFQLWDNSFILFGRSTLWEKTWIQKYSPEKNTWETVYEIEDVEGITIENLIRNKALLVMHFQHERQSRCYLWNSSGENVKKMKLHLDGCMYYPSLYRNIYVNQSFTKIISHRISEDFYYVHQLW